jgi:hypothetical protein
MAIRNTVLLALVATTAQGTSMSMARANPIRKVVTMLQKIQKKVEAEGEAETELHEKYMCFCKTNKADKTQAISDGEAKLESLAAGLESAKGEKTQLESDLTSHKSDREAAKQALAEATSMRENEAKAFAGVKAEAETNIKAMAKAVAAVEKGTGAAFLQADEKVAQKLHDLVADRDESSSKEEVLAFLNGEDSSAGSGEIVGVLKQLGDEMKKDLADATATEEAAIVSFNELTAAKQEEIATLTQAIEDKISRIGTTGLSIEDMKNQLHDTAKAKADDEKFLADLNSDCAKKEKEWDAVCESRQGELLALADTITMLNSDEALELFKKTLPSASASFLQLTVSTSSMKAEALKLLRAAQQHRRPLKIDLITLAMHGKSADFSKVLGMIDEMVGVLKTEQKDDDDKKEYCNVELDETEDRMKGHMQLIKDTEASIADAKETVETLSNEIKATQIAVAGLDAAVAQATAQRKKENAAFKDLRSGNVAAKDLIEMAKKRLNKFYNPKLALIQAPGAASFLQVRSKVAEAPALVQKKGEEAGGVIAMMDTLAADLEKETTIAETDEKDAQADYEKFMADSKTMRADSSKNIQDKESAKADSINALQQHEDDLEGAFTKLKGTNDQLKILHQDCDWLLGEYDARKEARADEIDSLGKAKAVLSGASFEQE